MAANPLHQLTIGQRHALRVLRDSGWNYADAATRLRVPEATVRSTVSRVLSRTGLTSREAIAYWMGRLDAASEVPGPEGRVVDADAAPRAKPARATTLYRYFDRGGAILYIGITSAGPERMLKHSEASDWWDLAASCTLVHFDHQDAALEAERLAIIAERPPYNRDHHPDYDTPEARRERKRAARARRMGET